MLRLIGLMRKEFVQIGRDPSALAVAFILPAVLLLIFGYGVSLDARNVPLALVVAQPDVLTESFTSQFAHSPYFRIHRYLTIQAAERAMAAREVNGVVWLRSDFSRRARSPGAAPIGPIVNGADANNARIVEGSVQQVWARWLTARLGVRLATRGRCRRPIDRQQARGRVLAAIDALPGPFRDAIVLRCVEGFSYQEMATIVGCPAGGAGAPGAAAVVDSAAAALATPPPPTPPFGGKRRAGRAGRRVVAGATLRAGPGARGGATGSS